MADPTSLYPTRSKGPLEGLSLGEMLNIARGSQEMQAKQSFGNIVRESIDPETGQFDAAAASRKLSQPGPHSYGAPEALGTIQQRQQTQLQTNTAVMKLASDAIGSLADDPSEFNFKHAAMLLSKALGPDWPASRVMKEFGISNMPSDPALRAQIAKNMAAFATGAASMGQREEGTPTGTGQPTVITAGQRLNAQRPGLSAPPAAVPGRAPVAPAGPSSAQPAPGGGMVSGQPAGQHLGQENTVQAANAFESRVDAIPEQRALLDNMLSLSPDAGTSKSTEFEKTVNQFWQRLFPGSGITYTAKELEATEKFDKFAEQVASAQAAAGHGSDAFLRNAYGANPNSHMSKLGRENIIRSLQGNFDADETKRQAWRDYKAGLVDGKPHADNEYRDWLSKFHRGWDFQNNRMPMVKDKNGKMVPDMTGRFDPRVFQFARLDDEGKKKFLQRIGAEPGGEFERRLGRAIEMGWITP